MRYIILDNTDTQLNRHAHQFSKYFNLRGMIYATDDDYDLENKLNNLKNFNSRLYEVVDLVDMERREYLTSNRMGMIRHLCTVTEYDHSELDYKVGLVYVENVVTYLNKKGFTNHVKILERGSNMEEEIANQLRLPDIFRVTILNYDKSKIYEGTSEGIREYSYEEYIAMLKNERTSDYNKHKERRKRV